MSALRVFLFVLRNFGQSWERSMGTIIFDHLVVFAFVALFLHFLFVR